MNAVAIEACAAWPVGVYAVAQISETTVSVRSFERLNRITVGLNLPRCFDPVGTIERGPIGTMHGVTVEFMEGSGFCRAWLDLIRSAWPGVRWRIGQAEGDPDLVVAFACLNGRVVGMVAKMREEAP